jgi:hypothetical protein
MKLFFAKEKLQDQKKANSRFAEIKNINWSGWKKPATRVKTFLARKVLNVKRSVSCFAQILL